MKKTILYSLLASVILLSTAAKIESNECDVRVLKNGLIQLLKPDYKYDSSNTSRFILESKMQGTEIEIPLYSTEKYRLLFNTSNLPVNVDIKIYNKKVGSKNRKLLYSSSDEETEGKIFTYEPVNQNKVYVDYILPGVEEKGITGCIVFLLGYKVG
jgi:hypothetical protein